MNLQKEDNINIIKELESGKYREQYLVYNRKSTDEPDNQKNSIKYQKSENTKFAFREHLPIADISMEGFCSYGIISEKHSAFKEDIELILGENGLVQYKIDRPKFYKLLQILNKGYIKGIVVLCWDRISRNKGDETIIRKLMKSGVDFRFVLATYDKTSSGALHMDIDGMFAEHHSRVTSEKVSLTIRNQRERGICTYKAPVGYLNLGSMDDKPFDIERAPIIKKFFELYATGNWALADLAKWAIQQGFTMPPFRRRRTMQEVLAEEEDDVQVRIEPVTRIPTFTSIQKILINPFYTGKILGNNGMYIPSHSHKALISEELFNAVQRQLQGKKVSTHYADKLEHPFRGLVRCTECGRIYTPYIKKGMVYFGARCAVGCGNTNRTFNMTFITDEIGKCMKNLTFTDAELEEINCRANTDLSMMELSRLNELEVNEKKKKKLREDLAYLRSNRLNLLKTGVYTPEKFVEEESNLDYEIIKLQELESVSDASMRETVKDIIKLSELLKSVNLQYFFASSFEKENVIKLVFSELSVFKKELKYKCRSGFIPLQNRFLPMCDLTGWLSELSHYHLLIKLSIEEMNLLIKK